MAALQASAEALTPGAFDAIELRGPGTELTVGLLPTSRLAGGRLRDPQRAPPPAEPPDRGGLHDARSRARRGPRHLDEAARAEGRHDRPRAPGALRGRPRGRDRRRRERRGAARARRHRRRAPARLGELALVDRQGRIGPLGTVFYDTLLDENAASHIALGYGFAFAAERRTAARLNKSEIHIDFMIGSPELEVTGVTADGERVPRAARRRLAVCRFRPRWPRQLDLSRARDRRVRHGATEPGRRPP